MKKVALIAGALVLGVTGIAVASTRDAAVPKASLTSTVKVHDGKPLGAHSVGHIQLKNSVIDCQKLVPSLRSAVCSLSLISNNGKGVKGDNGPTGTNGADGKNGADGAPGLKGDKGLSGLVTRHYDYIKGADYPGAGSGGIATVACDDDPAVSQTKVAIGGGVQFLNVGRNAGTLENAYVGETHITDSFPGRMDWSTNTPKPGRLDGWIVRLNNTPAVDMRVWVTCVTATSAS
jgi:hypothetical protein